MKVLFFLMTILTLTGCTTISVERALDKKYVNEIKNSVVYIIIPQDKVTGMINETNSGGRFGLIGDFLDSYETSKTIQGMKASVSPIHKATAKLDFRKDYLKALKRSKLFVHTKNIKIITKESEYYQDRLDLVATANGQPVVIIDVAYEFDYYYRTFQVNSKVHLFTKSKESSVKILESSYQSRPINFDYSFYSANTAKTLWPKNNAEKYKQFYKEGIADSVDMLKISVLKRPSNIRDPKQKVHRFIDYKTQYLSFTDAIAVKTKKDRTIFLDEEGMYYSVSTGPTYKSSGKNFPRQPNNTGRVFFYRTAEEDFRAIQPDVMISNRKEGRFIYGAFFYKDLKPGKHVFKVSFTDDVPVSLPIMVASSQIEDIKPISINIQKNKQYFVRLTGHDGLSIGEDALKVIQPEIAKKEISSLFKM